MQSSRSKARGASFHYQFIEGGKPRRLVMVSNLGMSDPNLKQSVESEYRWLDDDGAAFGGPGVAPRWTSSKKDSVSTAYAASSRVWLTVSHGTLNEIYYPTIDRPQTRDMELLFTDGESFFHEEKRDLTYEFQYIDGSALAVRVVANDLK